MTPQECQQCSECPARAARWAAARAPEDGAARPPVRPAPRVPARRPPPGSASPARPRSRGPGGRGRRRRREVSGAAGCGSGIGTRDSAAGGAARSGGGGSAPSGHLGPRPLAGRSSPDGGRAAPPPRGPPLPPGRAPGSSPPPPSPTPTPTPVWSPASRGAPLRSAPAGLRTRVPTRFAAPGDPAEAGGAGETHVPRPQASVGPGPCALCAGFVVWTDYTYVGGRGGGLPGQESRLQNSLARDCVRPSAWQVEMQWPNSSLPKVFSKYVQL